MKPLGLMDVERLSLIPVRFRAHHEFCFHLHDTMVAVLQEARMHGIGDVEVTLEEEDQARAFQDDPIASLLENGKRDDAKRIVLNQVTIALYSDLLHFLYEGLTALAKRKFSVAFALLRKPLKESMMFASWVCADEEDFFDRLLRSPADHMEEKDLPESRRLDLLRAAVSNLPLTSISDAQLIYDIVFNRKLDSGLAPLFDKAMHLVTSRGRLYRTEELNLNFIFKNPGENDLFEIIYPRLAYVSLYILSLQITLFSRMRSINESFTQWVLTSALGAYHALFANGHSPLVNALNKVLHEFLIWAFIYLPHHADPARIRS
jgi:hypothetical protein